MLLAQQNVTGNTTPALQLPFFLLAESHNPNKSSLKLMHNAVQDRLVFPCCITCCEGMGVLGAGLSADGAEMMERGEPKHGDQTQGAARR